MRGFVAAHEAVDNDARVKQLGAGGEQGRLNGRLVMLRRAGVRLVRPRRGNQRARAVRQNQIEMQLAAAARPAQHLQR